MKQCYYMFSNWQYRECKSNQKENILSHNLCKLKMQYRSSTLKDMRNKLVSQK